MKSNSTQALLVALGAAVITSLLYHLAAQLPQSMDPVFVLVSFIQLAPVAIVILVLLKFFIYERIPNLVFAPVRQSRFSNTGDEREF